MSLGSSKESLSPSAGCIDDNPNTTTQGASATISGSDCVCTSGTHDDTYPFASYDDTLSPPVWNWTGQSTCDLGGFGMLADVTIKVWCNATTGKWHVRAEFYHYPGGGPREFLEGEADAPNVSVDVDGDFTGNVALDMEEQFGTVRCSITVTFA